MRLISRTQTGPKVRNHFSSSTELPINVKKANNYWHWYFNINEENRINNWLKHDKSFEPRCEKTNLQGY